MTDVASTVRDFVAEIDALIVARKKMTSRLYQVILAGDATRRLLQGFVIHRWPIKSLWTRNVMGLAAQVEEWDLRRKLVENVYEEELGGLTGSKRHVETFADFGAAVGVGRHELDTAPVAPETAAVADHNLRLCNSGTVHFTAGVAGVLLLMEGQPPIVNREGRSMLSVMRDTYGVPPTAYEFFVHHASADAGDAVSELEDEHAEVGRELLRRHCTTEALREQARQATMRSIELRHRHFDMILDTCYDPSEPVFRYSA